MKLKGCHFDKTEVIDAESQAVLNTVTEYDLRMHLEIGRSTGSGTYTQKGTTLRVTVASRPNVSYDQMAAPVPEIVY
jgi:hypothetical protein